MASAPSNSIKWYIKLSTSFLEFVWLFDQEYSRQHKQSCLSEVLTHSTIVSGLILKKKKKIIPLSFFSLEIILNMYEIHKYSELFWPELFESTLLT